MYMLMNLFIHSLVDSLTHSFVLSFVRSFIQLHGFAQLVNISCTVAPRYDFPRARFTPVDFRFNEFGSSWGFGFVCVCV